MKICSFLTAAALVVDVSSASTGPLAALQSLDYRYFVAGGTCAAFSHGITTPIDVVKTKIQSEPEKYSRGMRQAALDIIKEEGPSALLAGLGPTVVGYGVEGAMKFGVYEVMKPVFASLLSTDGSNQAVAFLLASVVAGAIAALLLCPMESTRIKMVTDPAYAADNLLSALARLAASEGLASSFGGLWAMLSKQVPYTFGKQVSFDVFAGILYTFFGGLQSKMTMLSDGSVKWAVSVFAAAAASLVACILSQPGDMILTETYKPKKAAMPVMEDNASVATASTASTTSEPTEVSSHGVEGPATPAAPAIEAELTFPPKLSLVNPPTSSKGAVVAPEPKTSTAFRDVVNRLYSQGGIPKFFTGTQARIVHVGLIITSQLVIYDIVKQLLGLPATGSH